MTLKNRILRLILWVSRRTIPVDFFSQRYPVSIKGIIIRENEVLLLKNERDEWDLPGGKVRNDVSPEDCLIRETKEETNLDVKVISLEHTFIYNVRNWIRVFVIVYRCSIISDKDQLKISGEHFDKKFFKSSEIKNLNIHPDYKTIIVNILSE